MGCGAGGEVGGESETSQASSCSSVNVARSSPPSGPRGATAASAERTDAVEMAAEVAGDAEPDGALALAFRWALDSVIEAMADEVALSGLQSAGLIGAIKAMADDFALS